jgi:hypothetical protein
VQRPGDGLAWGVADAVELDGGGALVLEVAAGRSQLRRVDGEGHTTWVEPLAGAWESLARDASGQVHALASAPGGEAASVDLGTGATRHHASFEGRGFMDAAGRLFFVRYDAASRRRLWVRLDPHPAGRSEIAAPADDAAFPFLGEVFGVDARGRAYGLAGAEIGCVEPGGALAWRTPVHGLGLPGRVQWVRTWAVAPEGRVLIPSQTDAAFAVTTLAVEPA